MNRLEELDGEIASKELELKFAPDSTRLLTFGELEALRMEKRRVQAMLETAERRVYGTT